MEKARDEKIEWRVGERGGMKGRGREGWVTCFTSTSVIKTLLIHPDAPPQSPFSPQHLSETNDKTRLIMPHATPETRPLPDFTPDL